MGIGRIRRLEGYGGTYVATPTPNLDYVMGKSPREQIKKNVFKWVQERAETKKPC